MRGKKDRARPAAFAVEDRPEGKGSRRENRAPPQGNGWHENGGGRLESNGWQRETGGPWPENGGWHPDQWSSGQAPRVGGRYDAASFRPQGSEYPADSRIAGAPAAGGPRSAGRFDAEWCPKGARVRRNSLLRMRRRAGGGAMVRKATLDRGLRPDELAAADEAVRGGPEPAEVTERRPSPWRGSGRRSPGLALRRGVLAVPVIIRVPGADGHPDP